MLWSLEAVGPGCEEVPLSSLLCLSLQPGQRLGQPPCPPSPPKPPAETPETICCSQSFAQFVLRNSCVSRIFKTTGADLTSSFRSDPGLGFSPSWAPYSFPVGWPQTPATLELLDSASHLSYQGGLSAHSDGPSNSPVSFQLVQDTRLPRESQTLAGSGLRSSYSAGPFSFSQCLERCL